MTILLVEDQVLVKELLVLACEKIFPGAILQAAKDAKEALERCQELRPDLLFLDMILPDGEGIDLIPELRRLVPSVKIIGLSAGMDDFMLHRIFRLAIDGFIDKNEQTLDVLREAALSVMAGVPFFSAAAQRKWSQLKADPLSFTKVLSEREMKMLSLFGAGLDNAAIASRLGLSAATVRNHRQNIMDKLELRSTPQLMHYALKKGFARIAS